MLLLEISVNLIRRTGAQKRAPKEIFTNDVVRRELPREVLVLAFGVAGTLKKESISRA